MQHTAAVRAQTDDYSRAGLSLMVTRPETEPRAVLGVAFGDVCACERETHKSMNKNSAKNRAENSCQLAPWACWVRPNHSRRRRSVEALFVPIGKYSLYPYYRIMLGSRAHGSSENHRRKWSSMAIQFPAKTTCTIGRAPDNSVVLDDPRASRYTRTSISRKTASSRSSMAPLSTINCDAAPTKSSSTASRNSITS